MTAPGTTPGSFTGWWVKRNVVIFPTPPVLVLTGYAPITVPGTYVVPITVALTLTGSTPTIVPGIGVEPTAAPLTLTGHDPTIRGGVFAAPPASTLTLTGYVPVLDSGIRPAASTLTLTGHVPVLDSGIRPAASTLTLTGHAPSVVVVAPVVFDAVGAGDTDSAIGGITATASWSHTASGSNRAVLVAAAVAITDGTDFDVLTATYGGTSMTQLASEGFNDDPDTGVVLWGLLNPATGAQTVNVNVSATSTGAASVAASSVSYTGVSAFGATDAEFGTGTSRSQTVASAFGERVVQAFGQGHITAMTSYNQTQRDDIYLDNAALDVGLLVGDAAGTGSNISYTASGPSADWCGVAVRVVPV